MIFLTGCSLTPDEYTATSTFTVPEVPAVPAQDVTFTTASSGTYVIGQSPSEYVTGNEVEFTTGQSGNYICGEDFPAGTYDIEAVSGSGNVMSSGGEGYGLNEIMGSGSYSIEQYDNYMFTEGETLQVTGVSIDIVGMTEAIPAVPAVPSYDIEESATYNVEDKTTLYYQDGEEVTREKMNTANELDADIQAQIKADESE